ncbi:MAG: glycosyltransferase, partial [Lachnospiraceae bacterium]|nr:glycosyltransferase [Lachnospiraceae bacterium]
MFSLKKWKKYTYVSEISVAIALKGIGKATLIGIKKDRAGDCDNECVLDSICFDSDEDIRLTLHMRSVEPEGSEDADEGELSCCYLKIDALRDVQISEGAYEYSGKCEEAVKSRRVKLACCICTYHREEYVIRNVRLMSESLLSDETAMSDSLEIFVIDNGRTLKEDFFAGNGSDKIHLIYNPNYGGSAGFTRGMLEAVIYRKEKDFTHVIFMDDDIQIYPEVLVRTKAFLQVIREEYQDNILGGAMLLLEQKHVQAEACGYYEVMEGSNRIAPWNGMDLKCRENIILNEEAAGANFSGWWYSCIPVGMVRDGNLPLPLFLHRDDQDYGVRSGREILQLNGICIWHPSPSGKHADNINFYDMRNMLITIMDICPEQLTKKHLKHYLISEVIKKILGYQYRGAAMSLYGCEAFLDGPQSFLSRNPEELHKELLEQCQTERTTVKASGVEVKRLSDERRLPVWLKIIRYLRPDNRTCYVEAGCNYPSYLGYKRVIYIDKMTPAGGYKLERSAGDTLRIIFRLAGICRMVDKRLDAASEEWIRELPVMKTLFFWESYLHI